MMPQREEAGLVVTCSEGLNPICLILPGSPLLPQITTPIQASFTNRNAVLAEASEEAGVVEHMLVMSLG